MPRLPDLHHAAEQGDLNRALRLGRQVGRAGLNLYDANGYTPLMHAVQSSEAGADMVRALIELGADLEAASRREFHGGRNVLAMALQGGDLDKVRALLDAGANLHYSRRSYGAAVDAVHSARAGSDAELLPLIELLIEYGVRWDGVTRYNESAVRVLSNTGRFASLKRLLESGADPAPLHWTALHHAIACGSLGAVEAALAAGEDPEARDCWQRTALLLAIQTGELRKVERLLRRDVNREARGRCGKPPLFYAIDSGQEATLNFLLEQGFSPSLLDEHGMPALSYAAEQSNLSALRLLLAAGMDPDQGDGHLNALFQTTDPGIAKALLDAGADVHQLPFEARRAILGLEPEPSTRHFEASLAELQRAFALRFGASNPERSEERFFRAMVASGISGYQAADHVGDKRGIQRDPVWCAQRYGQPLSFLPDGRIIQIGGEHEDHYDPDFCIYNDVFVHHPNGEFEIYTYPERVFPPTDFHSATVVGRTIYIIGGLGYHQTRRPGFNPVYALDTQTLRITRIETQGDMPGWIYKHRARLIDENTIEVSGGYVETDSASREQTPYRLVHRLDLGRGDWGRG